uniref:Rho-GAP domain-containing protein n=1 Tax=Anolis carolinensis TaxID=28377 RepID=A0A803U064_ANOCA
MRKKYLFCCIIVFFVLVPPVLKSCAEFIETHGIVDGIYRLSGVTSNIQKLR